VQPNLVILCMRLDDADAFNLLSMLKLDDETRRIPIVTYAQEFDAQPEEQPDDDDAEDDFPVLRPSVTMN
jgi:PleD family two-component response regulator